MLAIMSLVFLTNLAPPMPIVPISRGMVITKSCSIKPADYLITSSQGTMKAGDEEIPKLSPAITIRGNNIVVDFEDVILRGSPATTEPDKRKGLGIRVEGNNITLKHLNVRGYKVGLWAKNCKNLSIKDSNFSYNWKQHLMSTLDKEDLSDWQSYHHNENNEWLRYGAGLYLEGCNSFSVTGTKALGGQCGLMLVRSNAGLVKNNDFSFLSGLGLGMYHSSHNFVLNNKMDWCVRGFSYGVYNRGQDSAGILIFELCNNNTFAWNSVTHGGDGFFLWAGQTMMDTGKGGCNGNVLYGNDFSHSPCNAIEATFSSNDFINNKLVECWHGVWGGFSFSTKIEGNVFGYNGEAIAIEHGQDIAIKHNIFVRDNSGINLWQNPITDKTWGYPKFHDTDSRDYQIAANKFDGLATTAIQINNTHRAIVAGNEFVDCNSALKESGTNTGSQFDLRGVMPGNVPARTISTGGTPVAGTSDNLKEYFSRFNIPWAPYADIESLKSVKRPLTSAEQRVLDSGVKMSGGKNGQDPFLKAGTLRGQRYILIDEWGPYDFRSPLLWPRESLTSDDSKSSTKKRFEILGPKGRWHVVSKSGEITLSASSGTVPGFVDIELPKKLAGRTEIVLEYIGGATADHRGVIHPAGTPVRFGYSQFFTTIDWNVKLFKWDESTDPRTHLDAFEEMIKGTPVKEMNLNKLDFAGASFDPTVGNDHFATICDGTFEVPAGTYQLEVTTDDGAKVWVDGKEVIQGAWKYQGPTLYTADLKLDATKHTIRIQHFQIDGYAALKVNLKPAK